MTGETNLVPFRSLFVSLPFLWRSDSVSDLLSWPVLRGVGSNCRFMFGFPHYGGFYFMEKRPDRRVTQIAIYINSNHALRHWGNGYLVAHGCTGLTIRQDSIYYMDP